MVPSSITTDRYLSDRIYEVDVMVEDVGDGLIGFDCSGWVVAGGATAVLAPDTG